MQVEDLITRTNTDHTKSDKAAQLISEYKKNSTGVSLTGVDSDITDSIVKVEKGDRKQVQSPVYNRSTIRTAAEAYQKQMSTGMDERTASSEMILAAHTLSKKDYQEMQENGFDPKDTDSKTFVTIADKIRMALVKGGHDVSITGGISRDAIQAMSGSAAEANALESAVKQTSGDSANLSADVMSQAGGNVMDVQQALDQADLPTDQARLDKAQETITKSAELPQTIDQNTAAYLVKNEMQPTVNNVLTASFAGNTDISQESALTDADIQQLLPQIEEKIGAAGLTADDTQVANAVFLLKNDVPLTEENIRLFNDLNGAQVVDKDEIPQAITDSVKEGKEPTDAMAVRGFSAMDKARDAMDVITNATDWDVARVVEKDQPLTIENLKAAMNDGQRPAGNADSLKLVTAQRQLEETRLVMTTEANFRLIQNGVSIDTTELSELVEDLKAEEKTLGQALFPDDIKSAKLFDDTTETVNSARQAPAAIISSFKTFDDIFSSGLTEIASGKNTQSMMKKAGTAYETLATEVRPDLGDSIKKAFANVDDILEETGLDVNDENRRAVRILAYNSREITKENVADVKAADTKVQNVFKNLTPGVVMKLIRKGENPLKMSMNELYDKTEDIKKVMASNGSQADKDASDYADFLWKAQKSGRITDEEEQSFIGLYRLMHQIDVTDGAPIGALLAQGADVTMENLMVAVRSRRNEGEDYRVDDSFSKPESSITNSITDQIETAFQTRRIRDAEAIVTPDKLHVMGGEQAYMPMSPDELATALEELSDDQDSLATEQKLYEQRTAEIEKAATEADENTYRVLTDAGMPDSAVNLTAVNQMLREKRLSYTRLYGAGGRRTFGSISDEIAAAPDDLDSAWDKLIEDFSDAMEQPKELAKAEEELYNTAEKALRRSLADDAAEGRIDIRLIQQSVRQLSVMKELSEKKETYAIPVMVGDEPGNMNLKIVRGKDEKKGLLDIALDSDTTGAVYARFEANADGGIDGKIRTDRISSRDTISENLQSLAASIQEKLDGASVSIVTEYDGRTNAAAVLTDTAVDFETTEDRSSEIQTKTLYSIAKGFVETVGDLFR